MAQRVPGETPLRGAAGIAAIICICACVYNLSKFKTLKPDGIIIIHRHKKEEDNFPKEFKIIEEKKYGISKIIFGKFI